jgi:NagD protein
LRALELCSRRSHLEGRGCGGQVEEKNFYTSALSTANFLSKQKPHGTAYVIGDAGILNALYNEGTADHGLVSAARVVSCKRARC